MWTTVLGAAGLTVGIFVVLKQLLKKKTISIQDKVVLITGASSGLGEACAHVFYKAGAKLILSARRTEELERVKKAVQQNITSNVTYEPQVLPLDLTDFESLPGKVRTAIGFHGKIDILVNNGGVSSRAPVVDTPLHVDMRVMNVNYFGQVAMTKAVLPYMIKERSGHILVVSSLQGRIGIPFRSSYGASKHAVQGFFDCLRAEMAEHNIGVSVISPGYIKTSLSLNALTKEGQPAGVMEQELATGMSAEYAALVIMKAIMDRKQEVLVGPLLHRIAVYGRALLPTIFFQVMEARAAKLRKEEEKNN